MYEIKCPYSDERVVESVDDAMISRISGPSIQPTSEVMDWLHEETHHKWWWDDWYEIVGTCQASAGSFWRGLKFCFDSRDDALRFKLTFYNA